ncbi:hypothetical protein FRC02_010216 [Tulasnella sp. 418]|nr:hypothetical protein FRC02_010216 [Tulasnella sp. 418]
MIDLLEVPEPPYSLPIRPQPSEATEAIHPYHQIFEVSHSTISCPSRLPSNEHPGGRRNSPERWASSITQSQDDETEEEQCDNVDSAEETGLPEANGPAVNVPRRPSLTSSEVALMLYCVHLGGPVWD